MTKQNATGQEAAALNGNGTQRLNVEKAVVRRYAEGAQVKEEALCCPVTYDPRYLNVIPEEILEKDYGCGDPSQYVRKGEVVLDLGSGGGKICYIASQVVGPEGRVIGVDFNPTMLALARRNQDAVAQKVGWSNVEFHRAKIQDLKTDFEFLEKELRNQPIKNFEDYVTFQDSVRGLCEQNPLIPNDSVDVIISNCVLNLVRTDEKERLFSEMYRVLRKGGRVAISDIVSDEEIPPELQNDPELWSGCISGAFQEQQLIQAFERSGFYGIAIEKWEDKPWRVIQGIEFRSVTITAYKGKEGPCFEGNQAVVYKGPWKEVVDDDQHVLKRGVRTAVCDKTFQILSRPPYKEHCILIEPHNSVPPDQAQDFDCKRLMERSPKESKGQEYTVTTEKDSSCLDGGCC